MNYRQPTHAEVAQAWRNIAHIIVTVDMDNYSEFSDQDIDFIYQLADTFERNAKDSELADQIIAEVYLKHMEKHYANR